MAKRKTKKKPLTELQLLHKNIWHLTNRVKALENRVFSPPDAYANILIVDSEKEALTKLRNAVEEADAVSAKMKDAYRGSDAERVIDDRIVLFAREVFAVRKESEK